MYLCRGFRHGFINACFCLNVFAVALVLLNVILIISLLNGCGSALELQLPALALSITVPSSGWLKLRLGGFSEDSQPAHERRSRLRTSASCINSVVAYSRRPTLSRRRLLVFCPI